MVSACLQSIVLNSHVIRKFFSDDEGSYKVCRRICDELDAPSHCTTDYEIIREVCQAVSQRSAAIVAAGSISRPSSFVQYIIKRLYVKNLLIFTILS